MRVVLDAGPIIHLSWIDRLDLLDAIFEEVLLPAAVRDEILAAPAMTLGIVREARESGLLPSVLPLLIALRQHGL